MQKNFPKCYRAICDHYHSLRHTGWLIWKAHVGRTQGAFTYVVQFLNFLDTLVKIYKIAEDVFKAQLNDLKTAVSSWGCAQNALNLFFFILHVPLWTVRAHFNHWFRKIRSRDIWNLVIRIKAPSSALLIRKIYLCE